MHKAIRVITGYRTSYGCKLFVLMAAILLFAPTIGCGGSEKTYSFRQVRRQYKAIDAQLIPIKEIPSSVTKSPYGPGNYARAIEFEGRKRRYELHVPTGYTPDKPWPLIINFHGGGGHSTAARVQSDMDKKSDSAGFIVMYPDGTGPFKATLLTWNAGDCCGYAVDKNIDDVAFTRAIIDDLGKFFLIDPSRIYATGLSNGAFMSYRVACELSDRIAAVATIAGVMTVDECKPARPVPVIHFHGTLDEYSPYAGGVGKKSISKTKYRSVDQTIREWLEINKIPSKPVNSEKLGHAVVTTYKKPAGAEVVLVTLDGMGHTWPDGTRLLPVSKVGLLSRDISANDIMWDFFKRHPLSTWSSQ